MNNKVFVLIAVYLIGVCIGYTLPDVREPVKTTPHIEFGPVVFESVITESEETLDIEEFKCQFDPPLKHITLIMHYYTSYAMLNEEYWELNPKDDEEVWGWSDCLWQPEDDWAACDVYLKIPDTVVDVDDYAIETAGHENWHASCGYFHK